MQEEFVHDHVRDHDDREEDGEDQADELGALRGGFESEKAVDERRGQEVHGQLIGFGRRSE